MCIKLELDDIGEGLAAVEGTRNAQRYKMQHSKGKRKVELEPMMWTECYFLSDFPVRRRKKFVEERVGKPA